MELRTKTNAPLEAVLAIACTSVLVWFGAGLSPLWPLIWIAPVPVLTYALRNSALPSAIIAFLGWLFGCLNLLGYVNALGATFWDWLAIFGTAAAVFTTGVLAFRMLFLRRSIWAAVSSLPLIMVAFEYVRSLVTPHGTAGSLAYTQLGCLPVLQLASLAGPWGISFFLLLFSCVLVATVFLWPTESKRSFRLAGLSLMLYTAVFLFGEFRLHEPVSSNPVIVGLLSSDKPENADVAASGRPAARLLAAYSINVLPLVSRGARIVVLPEKIAMSNVDSIAQTNASIAKTSKETGAVIATGEFVVDGNRNFNRAIVYGSASMPMMYDKQHLLPPMESNITPGHSITTFDYKGVKVGIAICKDMDFADPARTYGKAGVGLALVPGWDFRMDGAWHGHIAIMRGVENGFSVARSAKNGLLYISDSRGRVLAETRTDSAPFASLVGELPIGHVWTLYTLLGDWFAWLCMLSLLRICWNVLFSRGVK